MHMRTGSQNSQHFQAYEHPPTPPLQYSPPATSQQFPRTPSDRAISPQPQRYSGGPPQFPLQRASTGGSSNSLVQYVQPQPSHRRKTDSTSTSTSSLNRISSSHAHYPPTPVPAIIPTRPSPNSSSDTYVARLRRAKATVWSARGQREDLDRSNSKEDKYNKKNGKRQGGTMRSKLISGQPSSLYSHDAGFYLPAHPRQLMPRLSANEAEDSDDDPFISGPNFFDTTNTAPSTKASIATKTTTSSTSPSTSAANVALTPAIDIPSRAESKSSESAGDGRGSPVEQMQSYFNPPVRDKSRRISRVLDDVQERQVGGTRKLFVVNASPSESEDEG